MEWTVFFLRWNPKSVPSVIRARGHRPDVCLPAAGFREVSNLPIEYFEAGPLKLPFQRYIYEANRQLLYVFFCLWQDGDEAQRAMPLRKGLRVLSVRRARAACAARQKTPGATNARNRHQRLREPSKSGAAGPEPFAGDDPSWARPAAKWLRIRSEFLGHPTQSRQENRKQKAEMQMDTDDHKLCAGAANLLKGVVLAPGAAWVHSRAAARKVVPPGRLQIAPMPSANGRREVGDYDEI